MTHHLGPQSKHYTIKFWAMPRRRGRGGGLFYTYCRDYNFPRRTMRRCRHKDGTPLTHRMCWKWKDKHATFSEFREGFSPRTFQTCAIKEVFFTSPTKKAWESRTMSKKTLRQTIWSFVQIMIIITFHTELDDEVQTGGKECVKQ